MQQSLCSIHGPSTYCDAVADVSPATVEEWLQAFLTGADHGTLLKAARRRCLALQPAAWIHAVTDVEFDAQLATLDRLRPTVRTTPRCCSATHCSACRSR